VCVEDTVVDAANRGVALESGRSVRPQLAAIGA
jgi:hypothetical protein